MSELATNSIAQCVVSSLYMFLQAVAIIRQKPEGVSAREFTERLALQFSQLQTSWKEKVAS